jgi:vacuolar protein sorting-associated protein 35
LDLFHHFQTRHSPDLHTSATTSNLLALLVAPINAYQSALTLLALPCYSILLAHQTYSTRRSIAHAIISSVLKNETVIETPEDVNGIFDLCHVLIKDQKDSVAGGAPPPPQKSRGGMYQQIDLEDLAEEQGWVARMVHLFRADNLDVQKEVRSGVALFMSPSSE